MPRKANEGKPIIRLPEVGGLDWWFGDLGNHSPATKPPIQTTNSREAEIGHLPPPQKKGEGHTMRGNHRVDFCLRTLRRGREPRFFVVSPARLTRMGDLRKYG